MLPRREGVRRIPTPPTERSQRNRAGTGDDHLETFDQHTPSPSYNHNTDHLRRQTRETPPSSATRHDTHPGHTDNTFQFQPAQPITFNTDATKPKEEKPKPLSRHQLKRQRLKQAAELEKVMSPEDARKATGKKQFKTERKTATELLEQERRRIAARRDNPIDREIQNFRVSIYHKKQRLKKITDPDLIKAAEDEIKVLEANLQQKRADRKAEKEQEEQEDLQEENN